MDYFGITEINTSIDSNNIFKAFYASGDVATVVFTSKAGDHATVDIPSGTLLPIWSRGVAAAGTTSGSGTLFGLY